MKILLLLLGTALLCACASEVRVEQSGTSTDSAALSSNTPADSSANPFQGKEFEAEAFQNETSGWGYTIAVDGKTLIHQPYIPGMSGTTGFTTREQALKTANLVIHKIKQGIFPPSVTREELDSLGGLN